MRFGGVNVSGAEKTTLAEIQIRQALCAGEL